jgi:hypothetical protein
VVFGGNKSVGNLIGDNNYQKDGGLDGKTRGWGLDRI